MDRNVRALLLVLLLMPLLACEAALVRGARPKPGLMLAPEHAAAAEPAANPLAGAFFDEGAEGDVRARSGSSLHLDAARWQAEAAGEQPPGAPPAPTERLLTYHGRIQVEVARTDDAVARFLASVVAWGGYLQSQQGATVTVRLPAARFDEAFAALRSAGRVLGESRQADDVTEEFTDLGIRIDNARKARDRLLEVLKLADKVEDILKVEAELRRLTEELERMEGRRKFLADQVAMATITAAFQAVTEAPPRKRSRQPSRFDWINSIGPERLMGGY